MTMKYDFLSSSERPKGIGQNLYLLGTSNTGPYMEPVYIKNEEHAEKIFGTENDGTLVKAFKQAYTRNKNISIYLMRISGKSATLDIEGIANADFNPYRTKPCLLRLRSIYAGEKYNTYSIELDQTLDDDGLVLESSLILNTDNEKFVYDIHNLLTTNELVKLINEDCRSGFHEIMASTDYPLADPHILYTYFSLHADNDVHEIFLEDGDDGLTDTRNDLYLACDMAYTLLSGKHVDTIVPVGLYVDDVHPAYLYGEAAYGSAFYSEDRDYLQLKDTFNGNKVVSYHEQLIDFCREQVALGYMTHGVIGMRPLAQVPHNIADDHVFVQRIVEASAFKDRRGFLENRYGQWVDKGFYISVVAHDLMFDSGSYYDNGAALYGAMLTGHFDTTTSLPLGEDVTLRYELSEHARYQLSRIGIVTFRDSVRHGIVVHSGVSAAIEQNDYHNVANVRMVQLAVAYMNQAVEIIYSGDYPPETRRMLLEDLVRERLLLLQSRQVLTAYDYAIRFNDGDTMGEIELTLMTKYTVQGITVAAQVKPTEGA